MQYNKLITGLLLSILIALATACSSKDDGSGNEAASAPGTVVGTVVDASSRAPLANVSISILDSADTEIGTSVTDVDGVFNVSLPGDKTYSFEFILANHYPSMYSNILVRPTEEVVLEAVLQINTEISGVGDISGQVTDATTGLALSGATLYFRAGINVQSGPVLAEATTDVSGNYVLLGTLGTGNYSCEIVLAGYITNYSNILVLGGQLLGQQNTSISPVINSASGETRIVLTWGEFPYDLDSHLTGPDGNNSATRFHIYFGSEGSETVSPFAALDVDDVGSYGPETITIKSQYQGLYRYSVHDYTNSGASNSSALSLSSAKVVVYQAGKDPRVFNVPAGVGTLWTVFEMTGNVITPINTFSDSSASYSIQSLTNPNDAQLIRNLPYK